MPYLYKTVGTCSKQITVELDGNKVKRVEFLGGCNGNLSGISKIVKGMTVEHIAETFAGTKCGNRPTSCPDQLAIAVMEAYEESRRGGETQC